MNIISFKYQPENKRVFTKYEYISFEGQTFEKVTLLENFEEEPSSEDISKRIIQEKISALKTEISYWESLLK